MALSTAVKVKPFKLLGQEVLVKFRGTLVITCALCSELGHRLIDCPQRHRTVRMLLNAPCVVSSITAIAEKTKVETKSFSFAGTPCRLFDFRLPLTESYDDEVAALLDNLRDSTGKSLVDSWTLSGSLPDGRFCWYCGDNSHEIWECGLKRQDYRSSRTPMESKVRAQPKKVWRPRVNPQLEEERRQILLESKNDGDIIATGLEVDPTPVLSEVKHDSDEISSSASPAQVGSQSNEQVDDIIGERRYNSSDSGLYAKRGRYSRRGQHATTGNG
jgi:hypothetical protein